MSIATEVCRQRLHGDLHAATQVQHQMQRALLLDVVVRQSSHVFTLSSSEDRSLLVITLIMVTTFLRSTFLPLSAIEFNFTRALLQSCAWPLFLEQLDTVVITPNRVKPWSTCGVHTVPSFVLDQPPSTSSIFDDSSAVLSTSSNDWRSSSSPRRSSSSSLWGWMLDSVELVATCGVRPACCSPTPQCSSIPASHVQSSKSKHS